MAENGNQQPPSNNTGLTNNSLTNNSSTNGSNMGNAAGMGNTGNASMTNTSGNTAAGMGNTGNTTMTNAGNATGMGNASMTNTGNASMTNTGNTGNASMNMGNTSNGNSNRRNNNRTNNNRRNNMSGNTSNTSNTSNISNTSTNNRSLAQKASNTVKSAANNAKGRITETTGMSEDTLMLILKVVLAVIVLLALFYVGRYYFKKYTEMVYNSPYLLDGIKSAKRSLVVSQDPKNSSYIPISRSDGKDGIQFTYDFWLLVETYDYKPGEWKHVFHKGNASGYPNRAPGVWLHPSKNALRFYMNSQEDILEYVDVDNIPARKWLHIALVLDDKDMDVYVNGYLKARKKLSSVPKQNNGDFWCNMFGGFEGYMARIRYYSRAITAEEILGNVRAGPGDTKCLDGSDVPQYLDDNWWYSV
jgi:hypothetical protein